MKWPDYQSVRLPTSARNLTRNPMKFILHNIGPIRRFEFDTSKTFQVIVGKNTVGKSYALTFVYILIKELTRLRDWKTLTPILAEGAGHPDLAPSFAALMRGNEYAVRDASREITRILQHLFDQVLANRLREPIFSSFGAVQGIRNQFATEPCRVEIVAKAGRVYLSIADDHIGVDQVDFGKYSAKRMRRSRGAHSSPDGRRIYVTSRLESVKRAVVQECTFQLGQITQEIAVDVVQVHYLPAIRAGLYQALSGLGPIIAQLARSRSLLSREISLPILSAPENDYFLTVSGIDPAVVAPPRSAIAGIADTLEQAILGGAIEIDQDTNRILFKPAATGLRLDLGAASSMVSQIAPLVAYCRYILTEPASTHVAGQAKDGVGPVMVMIEEPEAHLHPAVQVKLIEQLAALSQHGVKIVLTSHSDFIFNKVSNLVIAGALRPDSVAATLITMTEQGSDAKALGIDPLGIDDENFIDTAEALYLEKAGLLTTDA